MNSTTKIWLEALRSGDYQQGTGQLCKRGEKFCCLGVLADQLGILVEPGASIVGDKVPWTNTYIPDYLLPKYVQIQLSVINDGQMCLHAHTFEQIADYIEQEGIEVNESELLK